MKKTFLLPHRCKIAGWIVMVPLAVVWLLYCIDNIGGFLEFPPFGDGSGNIGKIGDLAEAIVDGHPIAYTIALSASMMLVAFSRERDEDEYTASVRMRCLILSFWIDFAIFAVATLRVRSIDYFYVMATQMFLILLLHIVLFNVSMTVIRRRRSHEE